MKKLTTEQIAAKADELKEKYKSDITPIVLTDKKTNEQVIGYLKEIEDYNVLMFALGKMMSMTSNLAEAAEVILPYCLIKEESSPRILSDKKEDIFIKASAVLACIPIIKTYANEFKKK